MLLKRRNGCVAELICWNMSNQDTTYALVMLDGGELEEWKTTECRVVKERKNSNTMESKTENPTNTSHHEICPVCGSSVVPDFVIKNYVCRGCTWSGKLPA